MNDFFQFISRSRAFIIFAILEIFAFWCVYRFNNYGSAVLFNTTNVVVAKAVSTQNAAIRYTKLNQINEDLARENLRMNALVTKLQNQIPKDSTRNILDSAMVNRYTFIYAETINLSTNQRNNYITINKGTRDGIEPNMGVISATGIVGRVKLCTENMSLITSILHSDNLVSAKIVKSQKLGSVKWEGLDPHEAEMLYVDMYDQIQKGDSVVTSGSNKLYPANVMVGTVKKVVLKKGQQFWNITLQLSTDFKNLAYVYVVKNNLSEEQKTLEESIIQKK